jgi:nicotinamide-nucleotide amidase
MSITAIILTQGTELLNGSIANGNAQFLCTELSKYNVHILEHRCIPDDIKLLSKALQDSVSRADIVISTGGLGPTRDDCTRAACAEAFDCILEENTTAKKEVIAYYQKRKRTCTSAAEQMATLPSIAQAITNPCGSAPAFSITKDNHTLFCFPGVPKELKMLFIKEIIPQLPHKEFKPLSIGCFGAGESTLMGLLKDISEPIAYCATRRGIQITFHTKLSETDEKHIQTQLAPFLYAWGHSDMARALGEKLVERKETVATAESCTSGAIAAWFTSIPGASRYFLEGSAVYSNAAKIRTCTVPEEMLITFGAVSEPVAISLAEGMRARAQSTWALSVTGIAGPGGGTAEKPVGTVHIAVAGPQQTIHKKLQLNGDRAQVLQSTMGHVLFLLYTQLTKQ